MQSSMRASSVGTPEIEGACSLRTSQSSIVQSDGSTCIDDASCVGNSCDTGLSLSPSRSMQTPGKVSFAPADKIVSFLLPRRLSWNSKEDDSSPRALAHTARRPSTHDLESIGSNRESNGIDIVADSSGTVTEESRDSNRITIPHRSLESAGYAFTQEIAQTNQGAIKLAADTSTGSLHCVKCYDKLPMRPESFELLKFEAELMFDLGKHPNVGGAVEIFQDLSSYYLVQPYYRGGNFVGLKKRASGAGAILTEDWWFAIFCQCLGGLAYMHSKAVMHCDIKEPNIMLVRDDLEEPEVVIIDLGVAQRANTSRSVIYGTPGYIPPEVWEAKNWYPQSDMFSFGVVVVQLLLGKTGIFTEGTRTYKEVREVTIVRPPPLELMPLEFPKFRWLAQKLLEKEYCARPTAASLLEEPWEQLIDCENDALGLPCHRHTRRSKTMRCPREECVPSIPRHHGFVANAANGQKAQLGCIQTPHAASRLLSCKEEAAKHSDNHTPSRNQRRRHTERSSLAVTHLQGELKHCHQNGLAIIGLTPRNNHHGCIQSSGGVVQSGLPVSHVCSPSIVQTPQVGLTPRNDHHGCMQSPNGMVQSGLPASLVRSPSRVQIPQTPRTLKHSASSFFH